MNINRNQKIVIYAVLSSILEYIIVDSVFSATQIIPILRGRLSESLIMGIILMIASTVVIIVTSKDIKLKARNILIRDLIIIPVVVLLAGTMFYYYVVGSITTLNIKMSLFTLSDSTPINFPLTLIVFPIFIIVIVSIIYLSFKKHKSKNRK